MYIHIFGRRMLSVLRCWLRDTFLQQMNKLSTSLGFIIISFDRNTTIMHVCSFLAFKEMKNVVGKLFTVRLLEEVARPLHNLPLYF